MGEKSNSGKGTSTNTFDNRCKQFFKTAKESAASHIVELAAVVYPDGADGANRNVFNCLYFAQPSQKAILDRYMIHVRADKAENNLLRKLEVKFWKDKM